MSWFEAEVAPDSLTACPEWAADADVCATAGGSLGGERFLAINQPPEGYEFVAEYLEWVDFPSRCYYANNQAWPRGCRIVMELVGPTKAVLAVQDRHILFYVDNPELWDQAAAARAGVRQEQAEREQVNREALAAERASAVGHLDTTAKIQRFARELFQTMNIGERECPASQAAFTLAYCGQTHGDAEIIRIATDLFLLSSEWFDGEVVTEWLGSATVPYKGVRIDDVLVTITFEGNLGPFGNFGRIYVNANF